MHKPSMEFHVSQLRSVADALATLTEIPISTLPLDFHTPRRISGSSQAKTIRTAMCGQCRRQETDVPPVTVRNIPFC